jgi:hypothetical protein
MLEAGLRGELFNKTAHRNALLPLLQNRSAGAVERKHQNISAILIEEHVPYISGYKPLGNYQALLRDVVLDQLGSRLTTRELIEADAQRVPQVAKSIGLLDAWTPPPPARPGMEPSSRHRTSTLRRGPVDYLKLEAQNRALGRAGEDFVLEFERQRLVAARRERLAAQIAHISVTQGDGAGYDILSFEEDSRERLIEVKTTKFGEYTPFYVSRNEVDVSKRSAETYHLYRLYDFGPAARLFSVAGALDATCALEPSVFVARLAS